MATKRQSTEQKRAAVAWTFVNEQVAENQQKKYGTLARKLPAMIQTNGLGTALAFLLAKGGKDQQDAHHVIFRHISEWVTQLMGYTSGDLMHLVRNESMKNYRRAMTESIEFAIWIKRYVEANDWGSAGDDNE